ncbi:hypothetical protein OOT08_05895, partial [Leucobacter sp. M11]|nr:hypothetical protein [Leucobacter sp. M11]
MLTGALLLTGCSGGSGDAKPEELEEGPLSKALSSLYEEQDQEFYDEQQKREQDLVAVCMTEQGFEYQPDTNSGGVIVSTEVEEDDGPTWGTVEFAKEYGYGIIDSPWQQEGPQEEKPYEDPNGEYVNSLSESEQTAYYEALNGPSDQFPEEGSEEEWVYDWTKAGCYGAAQHEVGGEQVWDSPEMAALQESMDQLYIDMEEHPDVIAVRDEWITCMTEAGFPGYTERYEPQNALYEEQNELYMPDGESGEGKEPSAAEKKKFQ